MSERRSRCSMGAPRCGHPQFSPRSSRGLHMIRAVPVPSTRTHRRSERVARFALEPATSPRRRRASLHRAARARTRRWTVCGFLMAAILGALTYFWPAISVAVAGTGHQLAGGAAGGMAPAAASTTTPFTVLLLGSDDDSKFSADHHLTQSMILVRIDPQSGHVTMLSIPRDLYVPLSTGGSDKIDTAYANGGAATAIATVEHDFNVQIDHYVWIGLRGLVNLIDR